MMAAQFSVNDGIPWKKRFFTIWSGQAFSLLGSQLVSFAIVWYLTVTTGSATVLAIGSLVGVLPSVLLGPFVGPLVDRWDRRKTMLVSDGIIALATLGLALLFAFTEVQIWQIYALLFVRAVAGGFHGPSMSASTSLMVPVEHLARVQGVNQMLNGGLNIIAAPLGAIMYEALDIQWILAIDVLTAIVAMTALIFFEIPRPDRSQSEALAGKGSSYLAEMVAGFRYVWSWKGLFILALMAALLNFLLAPTGALNPLLIKDHFNGTVIQLGTYNSLFGIGVILGGLLLSVWGGFKRKIITSMFGLMLLGAGVLTVGLLPSEMFSLALVTALLFGFGLPITNGSIGAIMQSSVAPDMQGRVFSLIGSLSGAMAPIGLAIAGPVSDVIGIQAWFILAGISCIAMALLGYVIPAVVNIETNNPNGKLKPVASEAVDVAGAAAESVPLSAPER
ncbi:MAG TPA: MFS transporter [Chloroflexi bacterium]|nr:MFS transporter [Chloroflexota bacterium]